MNKTDFLILALLFAVGFALRTVGLDWGYFHGDERINDAARVLTGDLVPGQHFYPPLFNYINGVAFAGLFLVGKVAGWWADSSAFRDAYFTDPTVFYLTARGVTAAFGAAMSPLFYLLARTFSQPRLMAAVTAALASIAAPAITFSYIAKGDTPLAAATVLTILAFSLRVLHGQKRYDVLLGVAVCLALSFKQSIVFLLVPLLVAHIVVLAPKMDWKRYLASLGRSLSFIILLWPILNIGIVLDLENFIGYQKIQMVMSIQNDASWQGGLRQWLSLATHPHWGIGWVMLLGFLLYPAVVFSPIFRGQDRQLHIALWAVVLVGMAITLFVVRERQPEHLWISFFVLMQFFAVFGFTEIAGHARNPLRLGAAGVLAASGIVSVVALIGLWEQARAVPMSHKVSEILHRHFADDRILSLPALDIPKHPMAQEIERKRIDRLAKKYEVVMPQESTPRPDEPDEGALFWMSTPAVMFGLENATEDELRDVIKPHAWPLQPEEWTLEYWTNQGVTVFVVADLPYLLNETPSRLFRSFYAEINNTCERAYSVPAVKPLFLERDVVVFKCPAHLE
ncbi:phospholipid carrier-dependent glycosyltransferase [Shimia thalassica]|uniref:phospholipid carrier-dependent glycosyltransferase n=1 Tax=Shimia thalassica TaxID=1715693 RepID=UPI0026E382C8|nr:phospholipid carrier-dependent glycosyltransferase [Shimia thalassica]MDO6479415.1 phospholipid carrier-dependent glycosyltransferase [Shimia thalassica]